MRIPITKIFVVSLFVIGSALSWAAEKETVGFPGLEKIMSEEEMAASGISELTLEQRVLLNKAIDRYVSQAASEIVEETRSDVVATVRDEVKQEVRAEVAAEIRSEVVSEVRKEVEAEVAKEETPLRVAALRGAGSEHTCVVWATGGEVECWGDASAGQLGTAILTWGPSGPQGALGVLASQLREVCRRGSGHSRDLGSARLGFGLSVRVRVVGELDQDVARLGPLGLVEAIGVCVIENSDRRRVD